MIKINPSGIACKESERCSTDVQWQDFKVYFAVGVERPHYQHLILYGQDGPDPEDYYYVWLAFGKMTGLHEGLIAAINAMYEQEGLHVYGCNGFKDALAWARNHNKHASEHETISLYYCALAVAENDHGADSSEYGVASFHLAKYYKEQGDFEAAYDFLKKSAEIAGNRVSPEHEWMRNCQIGLADLEAKLGRV